MGEADAVNLLRGDAAFRFAQEVVDEQATAQADAVNAPDREIDPFGLQHDTPGQDVLVDGSDQRAIQVNKQRGLPALAHLAAAFPAAEHGTHASRLRR